MKRLPMFKIVIAAAALLAAPINALSQTWQSLPNMNKVRFEASAVQYRDNIFVFNGFKEGINIEPSIEMFDAGTQRWSVVGSTSVSQGNAVTHNGVVRIGNEAWFIGGRIGRHPGRVSSDVWIFNLDSKRWSKGPQLPVAGAAGGAAFVNNKIHWFGGTDANARCDVANHFVLDLNSRSAGWKNITNVAAMPSPRNHFSTAVHNGVIYALGGQYGHDGCPGRRAVDVNLVHAFNPSTNRWSAKAKMPTAQSHTEASTFVYRNAIYVVGGEVNGNKIFRFDLNRNKWDTVLQLPSLIVAPIARVIDNKLIVSSGGAPNYRFPTNKTFTTSMQPLLLSGGGQPVVVAEEPVVVVQDPIAPIVQPQVVNQEPVVPVVSVPTEIEVISLEAEYFGTIENTDSHSWLTNTAIGASDSGSISTPNFGAIRESSVGSPSVGYYAYFNNPGKWYVWIRGSGDTVAGEGSNDSLHAGVNGVISPTADKIHNFPSGWNWTNATRDRVRASVNIPSKGIHLINLWMREDGLEIDKIVLSNDPSYRPSGLGPEHFEGASSEDIVTTEAVVTVEEVPSTGDSLYDNIPCIDTDGDGWGWQQSETAPGRSCLMSVEVTTTDAPVDIYQDVPCLDSDGDGWGWQQVAGSGRSCRM